MSVKLAVVGAGRMGRTHIAAALEVSEVELVAIVDPAPGVAQRLAPPGVAALERIDQLPGVGVDAVVTAAPTPLHVQMATELLDQGLHVLTEKPVGFDPDAIPALAQHAIDRNRVLAVGFWRRVAWPYAEALRLVAAGAIGRPSLVRSCMWDATPPSPAFLNAEVSGGIEVDGGVHDFDMARLVLGAPMVSVTAHGVKPNPYAELGDTPTVGGVAATANGGVVLIDQTRVAGYWDDVRTEILGDGGSIFVRAANRGEVLLGDPAGLRPVMEPPEDCTDVTHDALKRQLRCFVDAIGGAEPHARVEDAAHALRAGLAFRQSRLSGETVRIAP